MFTFVNELLGLQVEPLPVTLPPQPGHGGVELAAAVSLHGGRSGHEVPLPPEESVLARAVLSPRQASWGHLQGEVVVGDVDEARDGSFVGIVLAPLPVSPRVRLVPVVGTNGHGEQPQRAQRQEKPRAG